MNLTDLRSVLDAEKATRAAEREARTLYQAVSDKVDRAMEAGEDLSPALEREWLNACKTVRAAESGRIRAASAASRARKGISAPVAPVAPVEPVEPAEPPPKTWEEADARQTPGWYSWKLQSNSPPGWKGEAPTLEGCKALVHAALEAYYDGPMHALTWCDSVPDEWYAGYNQDYLIRKMP